MSPLEGVVISTDNVLVIRLASRAQIRVAHQKDLRLGDTVYVLFDYTRLKVREVWTEEEHDRADDTGSEEPVLHLPPDWEPMEKWLVEPEGRLGPGVSL